MLPKPVFMPSGGLFHLCLRLLAPDYVAHHADVIHRCVVYLQYLRNYVFGQSPI